MSVKSLVTVGYLSLVVTAGVANASDGAASEAQRVNISERIGVGGSAYSSSQPDGTGTYSSTGVNITERMGHGGSTYSSSQPVGRVMCREARADRRKVDVSERVGHGGSIYPISRPNIQTVNR